MLHNYIISLKHAKERRMHIENEFNNKNRGLGSKIYFKGFSRNILSSILYKSSCL
ncbi:glycosyltransferase family 25 protein [Eikenella corrodens]|uniref:glycosyltransferase family 25 protein n=1 Tax=Eikenella corrodens TaxID=539 RepID=UPI00129C0FFE